MDSSQILSIFLRGALGSRGRKRARRAANFLSGQRGFLSASTLLGAAGVAWGIYDSLKQSGATATPGVSGAGAPGGVPGAVGASGAPLPPPIPGAAVPAPRVELEASAAGPSDALGFEVLRLVRLAVSAARADGTLLPAERALILSHAREAGVETVVEQELASPRPLAEIVAGVADTERRRDMYVLAYTIVRADEQVSGAERIYLVQLAHQLGLDASAVASLEANTAARIDQESDTPA